ncbi:hypothetical protein JL722_1584 [Aureococcus anophagefferens]|nr:hypothetical protein JL722_1584 [Aureococcus anophagefferens]
MATMSQRYRCTGSNGAVVREGCEMDSEVVGELDSMEEVVGVESRVASNGLERIRIEGETPGWVVLKKITLDTDRGATCGDVKRSLFAMTRVAVARQRLSLESSREPPEREPEPLDDDAPAPTGRTKGRRVVMREAKPQKLPAGLDGSGLGAFLQSNSAVTPSGGLKPKVEDPAPAHLRSTGTLCGGSFTTRKRTPYYAKKMRNRGFDPDEDKPTPAAPPRRRARGTADRRRGHVKLGAAPAKPEAPVLATWGYNCATPAPAPVRFFARKRVETMACGWLHCVATTESGVAFAWGANGFGQLGTGDEKPRKLPTRVALPSGDGGPRLLKLAHTAVLTSKGEVYCWGDNSCGQGGKLNRAPFREPHRLEVPEAAKLRCGRHATLCIGRDGGAYLLGALNTGGSDSAMPTSFDVAVADGAAPPPPPAGARDTLATFERSLATAAPEFVAGDVADAAISEAHCLLLKATAASRASATTPTARPRARSTGRRVVEAPREVLAPIREELAEVLVATPAGATLRRDVRPKERVAALFDAVAAWTRLDVADLRLVVAGVVLEGHRRLAWGRVEPRRGGSAVDVRVDEPLRRCFGLAVRDGRRRGFEDGAPASDFLDLRPGDATAAAVAGPPQGELDHRARAGFAFRYDYFGDCRQLTLQFAGVVPDTEYLFGLAAPGRLVHDGDAGERPGFATARRTVFFGASRRRRRAAPPESPRPSSSGAGAAATMLRGIVVAATASVGRPVVASHMDALSLARFRRERGVGVVHQVREAAARARGVASDSSAPWVSSMIDA